MKHSIIFCLTLLVLCSAGAQPLGMDAINAELARHSRSLERHINWERIRGSCPHDSSWIIHMAHVGLARPQFQEDFISGRFAEQLVANYIPSRLFPNRTIWTESLVFDEHDRHIGFLTFSRFTFPGCNYRPEHRAKEELVARVYRDSIPTAMAHITWYDLWGYIYRTSSDWYIITSDNGVLRNDPLWLVLKERWAGLVATQRYAMGEWVE